MPGKTARALCPVCQEPMPPDETECENCGAFVIDEAVVRLSRAFGIDREKALALFEKGFRHPKQLQDRNLDDVLRRGEGGLLYLCTNCGGFVASGDAKCARCGAEFEAEEEPPAEKDILDLVLCPVCGADNDPAWKECEICGEPLGGTEEPPGEAPRAEARKVEAETPAPLPVPVVRPERAREMHPLERIDDILKDLENPPPARGGSRVRPVQKLPKRAQAPKSAHPVPPAETRAPKATLSPAPRPPPGSATKTAPRPTPRRSIRPVPQPATLGAKAAPRAAPAATPARPDPTVLASARRRVGWSPPPPEFTGGVAVAGAVSLYLSHRLGVAGVAWAVALILATLSAYVLTCYLSRRQIPLSRIDGALLVAGAILGTIGSMAPVDVAPALAVAGAIPLALATRRLLKTGARDLLAVASAVTFIGLGIAAATAPSVAATPAWAFGLLAALPWPAAVAAMGVLQRQSSRAVQHELSKAEKEVAHEDYDQSLKAYDRAIALSPKGAPGGDVPWYGKGATLILLGRYEEALRAIDMALDMNPRNEVAWLNKGNALTKLGRLVDALRCFNAAIKVNPQYEVAWNNKGNALARLGHFEEALKCYERALAIDANYRGAWVNKGYVLTKLGRYDEATSCADRALRLHESTGSEAA